MANQTDYFESLFDFQACGIISTVVALATALVTVLAAVQSLLVLRYDNHINRRANLLTKLNSPIHCLFVLYSPMKLVMCFRFVTGIPMNEYLCSAMTISRNFAGGFAADILVVDAVFHYRFITFKSQFPIIREDLVHTILVRSVFGLMLSVMVKKYHLSDQPMPLDYYICTGTKPETGQTKDYCAFRNATAQSKTDCDFQHCSCKMVDSMDNIVAVILVTCYLAHVLLLTYAKFKHYSADQIAGRPSAPESQASVTVWKRIAWVIQSQDPSIERNKISVDVGQLIIKMIFASVLVVFKKAFDFSGTEQLTVFPG